MPLMVERNKWILYKHTCDYEIIKAVALDVKNTCKTDISPIERQRMQERLALLNLYKMRNPKERPLDSINHRINTLEYWMFGYEDVVDCEKRFIFSPLGNLFLKYINDKEKLKKIFIAMLFAFQFQHSGSSTNKRFQLYPFRLIFKLLLDKRLSGKLYNNEVEYLLVFVKNVTVDSYEKLVKNILELRQISDSDMADLFRYDEHTYVNSVYEWEYYTQSLFKQIGIIECHVGELICKLYHPTKTNSKSNPTGRKATRGFVSIEYNQIQFVEKMLQKYSCFETPVQLNDPERLYIDCVKEVYSFYPQLLLNEINESDSELDGLLKLPKLITEYANNPENDTAYLFENMLTRGFNMFINVCATKRGGAAHTDIECLYTTKKKKFAVESKSTANKLISINAGRLREHRDEIGGEYTIVITPRYVPAAKRDIAKTPIVIVLANTFAEYLYNHIFHDARNMDYADFDDIIVKNFGTDISKLISNLTLRKFATSQ